MMITVITRNCDVKVSDSCNAHDIRNDEYYDYDDNYSNYEDNVDDHNNNYDCNNSTNKLLIQLMMTVMTTLT